MDVDSSAAVLYPMSVGVLVVEDEGMMHLVVLGINLFRSEVEDGVESTC